MNPTKNRWPGAIYSPVSAMNTLQLQLNSKLTCALMSLHHCALPLARGFWSGNSCFPQTMKLSGESKIKPLSMMLHEYSFISGNEGCH